MGFGNRKAIVYDICELILCENTVDFDIAENTLLTIMSH